MYFFCPPSPSILIRSAVCFLFIHSFLLLLWLPTRVSARDKTNLDLTLSYQERNHRYFKYSNIHHVFVVSQSLLQVCCLLFPSCRVFVRHKDCPISDVLGLFSSDVDLSATLLRFVHRLSAFVTIVRSHLDFFRFMWGGMRGGVLSEFHFKWNSIHLRCEDADVFLWGAGKQPGKHHLGRRYFLINFPLLDKRSYSMLN